MEIKHCFSGHEILDPLLPCPRCISDIKSLRTDLERGREIEKRLDTLLIHATHKRFLTPAEKTELLYRINEFILGLFPVMEGSTLENQMVFNENRARNYAGKIIKGSSPEELLALTNRLVIMLQFLRENSAVVDARRLVQKREQEKAENFAIQAKFNTADKSSAATKREKLTPRDKMIKDMLKLGMSKEVAEAQVDAALKVLINFKK